MRVGDLVIAGRCIVGKVVYVDSTWVAFDTNGGARNWFKRNEFPHKTERINGNDGRTNRGTLTRGKGR